MAKAGKARRPRSTCGRSEPQAQTSRAAAVTDERGHRFPWPADPHRRLDTPWLAVVNARGPWAVWRHDRANPPFIPLCLDLLGKGFWRRATDAQRAFAVTLWLRAAQADDWGIVWGDPLRMHLEWGMPLAEVQAGVAWMIDEGLACYLTHDEMLAVKDWRPMRKRDGRRATQGDSGEREGGSKRGEEQGASRAEQAEQEQESVMAAVSQSSSRSASAIQIPDSGPKGQEPEQAEQEQAEQEQEQAEQAKHSKQVTASKSQPRPQAQPESTEPASLPKSDHGAGGGSPRTTGGVRGRHRNPRPPSVSDVHRLGDSLGWSNPAAVVFGRAMYEAITGHQSPQDLTAAPDAVKGDVGVWVHYWVEEVEPALPVGQRGEFAERCVRDVRKKLRSGRRPRNPGGLARAKIVPGILASMP